ncbi:MAG: amidohydrolase [Thermoleophilia bacterium]
MRSPRGRRRSVSVYDLHQHLLPEHVLSGLAARRSPPRLRGRRLDLPGEPPSTLADHALDARLKRLDAAGIDIAVVSLPPTLSLPPDLVDAYHEGIVEVAAAADGRILPLAAGVAGEGFVGSSVPAEVLLDLDRLAPLAAELERKGRFLFVHPGPAHSPERPPWWPAVVDYTAQMQAAYFAWLAGGLGRWPRLPVLFAILAGGAPFQLERLVCRGGDLRPALQPTLFLDTASYGRRALELSFSTFGVASLVFGSDFPVVDPRMGLRAVGSFGDAVTSMLCQENPRRLLAL